MCCDVVCAVRAAFSTQGPDGKLGNEMNIGGVWNVSVVSEW
jgi:hypothetical protein